MLIFESRREPYEDQTQPAAEVNVECLVLRTTQLLLPLLLPGLEANNHPRSSNIHPWSASTSLVNPVTPFLAVSL